MASFNRCILMGHLTRDVSIRYTPSGTAVADIGLAINERIKRGEEWVEEPTFVEVTLWGRTAEVAGEYLAKGSPAFIEGRLKLETWHDRDSGDKRSRLKVVADRLQLLPRSGDKTTPPEDNEMGHYADSVSIVAGPGMDDVPF